MSDTDTVAFIVAYVCASIFFGIAFYFVWFRGASYQRFMNNLFDKTHFNEFFGSYTKSKRYLIDQRLAITAGFVLLLALALAVLLKR